MRIYRNGLKRIVDILVSFCVFLLTAPFLLVVMVWLYFANQGACVFFLQERPGKKGKIF